MGDHLPEVCLFGAPKQWKVVDARIMSYNDTNWQFNTEKECAICLSGFEPQDTLFQDSCKHVFHWNCMKEWLSKKDGVCPMCKAPMKKVS